jgi:hypothetical protein
MLTEKRCFSQFFDVKNPMKVRVTALASADGRHEPPVRTDSRGATIGARQLRLRRANGARRVGGFGHRFGKYGAEQLAAPTRATSRGILLDLFHAARKVAGQVREIGRFGA